VDAGIDARALGGGLTAEDERILARRIQQGDEAALNALVEANLRFAMFMANRYRRRSIDIDDLIQEANIGLMLAARHYDPDRGVRFTSYAGRWAESQLHRFVSRHASVIRVGEGTQQTARRLRRIEEKLWQEQPHVTLDMVAHEAEVDLTSAQLAIGAASADPLSLDQPMGAVEGEFTLQDVVADDSSEQDFTRAEDNTVLRPLLEALDPRQRRILHMRYEESRTFESIGHELGISWSRAQQIEAQAIRCLRRRSKCRQRPRAYISDAAAA